MSDESHIPVLEREDFTEHQEKLRRWARSLDTTPERLEEILHSDGDAAKQLRQLLGIKKSH